MESNNEKPKMTTISVTHKMGIDDLENTSAYTGSWGQGDHYSSNDVSANHPSYVSFKFKCEETQEAVDNEIKRLEKQNEEYIAELKRIGRFEEEYQVSATFVHHPLFDEPKAEKPLMSSSFFIFDLTKSADETQSN